jgi:uncharacterized protein related to proFAR isomerase
MNNLVKELENKMNKLSINDLDNIISRMENMEISNEKDQKVDDLMNSMKSLNIVPKNQKIKIAIKGVRKYRNNKFNRIYKSLKGKKSKPLTQNQINDIFETMYAMKRN